MNRRIIYLVIFLIALVCFSCEQEELPFNIDKDKLYMGYWVNSGHTDSTKFFKRTSELETDTHAFAILRDGLFQENKNSGWCLTPPIHYKVFNGSWKEISTDTLLITNEYRGEVEEYYMILKYVSLESLEVKKENPENSIK